MKDDKVWRREVRQRRSGDNLLTFLFLLLPLRLHPSTVILQLLPGARRPDCGRTP
jgi:hypothetical protein